MPSTKSLNPDQRVRKNYTPKLKLLVDHEILQAFEWSRSPDRQQLVNLVFHSGSVHILNVEELRAFMMGIRQIISLRSLANDEEDILHEWIT